MSSPPTESLRALAALLADGQFDRAIGVAEALVAASPNDAAARLALARTLRDAGRIESALASYDAALALDDRQADAWFEFSRLLVQIGERDVALGAMQRHLALDPRSARGWFVLGQILLDANRAAESEDAIQRALALDARLIEQRFALGQAALQAKATDFAAIHFHACTKARPDWLEAHLQLGHTLIQRRRFEPAYKVGITAAALAPDDPRGLDLQALALEHANANPAQLLPVRQRVAEMLPDSAGHQFLFAIASSKAGRYDLTHGALQRTLQLMPGFLPAMWASFLTPQAQFHANAESIARYIEDWDAGIARFEAMPIEHASLLPRLENSVLTQSNFYLGYTATDVTARQLRYGRLLQRVSRALFPEFQVAPKRAPIAGRKLRIGFVTPTLRHHTVIKLFGGLMQRLPRERFVVHAYGVDAVTDAWTDELRGALDSVKILDAPLKQIATEISNDTLDAIVHLDVGMHSRSALIGSMRLAPFQALLWGHPVTTGMDSIDAFLSSAAMEPENGAQHYTESLLRLPALGCWYDPQRLQLQPDAVQRPNDQRIRLVCAQSGPKLLPLQDELFARILKADERIDLVCLSGVPTAVLPTLEQRMFDTLQRHSVDTTRLRVLGQIPEPEFLTHLWQADLALDAIGWSGGVTAFETFRGDVPILTVPGEFMRGRHTYAMLSLMELPELIATDVDDYVQRAIALAQNAGERERLRALIHERKHRLYRDDRVIDAFAELLEREVAARIG